MDTLLYYLLYLGTLYSYLCFYCTVRSLIGQFVRLHSSRLTASVQICAADAFRTICHLSHTETNISSMVSHFVCVFIPKFNTQWLWHLCWRINNQDECINILVNSDLLQLSERTVIGETLMRTSTWNHKTQEDRHRILKSGGDNMQKLLSFSFRYPRFSHWIGRTVLSTLLFKL